MPVPFLYCFCFSFNAPPTTDIYTLSLHDALPTLRQASSIRGSSSTSAGARPSSMIPAFCSARSEEHTSELQSHSDLVCRLLLEKKKKESMEIRRKLSNNA